MKIQLRLLLVVWFAFMSGLALTILTAPAQAKDAQPPAKSAAPSIQFEKRKIRLGKSVLTVEIADTPAKQERGLMFRENLPEGTGMLFVFEQERVLSFWMRNTLIPLNIGYFDRQRKLIDTHEMVPAVMGELYPRSYPSSKPALYALEVPKGWFSRHGIRPGDKFEFVDKTR